MNDVVINQTELRRPFAARCEVCKFWVNGKAGGECRRNPPIAIMVPMTSTITGENKMQPVCFFPPTPAQLWCGEWAPNWPVPKPVQSPKSP